mmetsp:Transcript_22021/g.47248  ORF Transcript_22021/g.47248 Transcript_22021/m.47248 type:complete len:314 (-) Transcript_22021:21-962(-)
MLGVDPRLAVSGMGRRTLRQVQLSQLPQRGHSPIEHLDLLQTHSGGVGRLPVLDVVEVGVGHPLLVGDDPVVRPESSRAIVELRLDLRLPLLERLLLRRLIRVVRVVVVGVVVASGGEGEVPKDVAVVVLLASTTTPVVFVVVVVVAPYVAAGLAHLLAHDVVLEFQIVRGQQPIVVVVAVVDHRRSLRVVLVQGVDASVLGQRIGVTGDAESSRAGDVADGGTLPMTSDVEGGPRGGGGRGGTGGEGPARRRRRMRRRLTRISADGIVVVRRPRVPGRDRRGGGGPLPPLPKAAVPSGRASDALTEHHGRCA